MKLTVFCDGLYEPRYRPDGWSCWAWIALDSDGETVAQDKGCLGRGREKFSNNVAEYHAVGRAVRWMADNKHTGEVFTDSQLVVSQVKGDWACHADHLKPLCARVQELIKARRITLEWVPREQNALADALTNEAYAEARAA